MQHEDNVVIVMHALMYVLVYLWGKLVTEGRSPHIILTSLSLHWWYHILHCTRGTYNLIFIVMCYVIWCTGCKGWPNALLCSSKLFEAWEVPGISHMLLLLQILLLQLMMVVLNLKSLVGHEDMINFCRGGCHSPQCHYILVLQLASWPWHQQSIIYLLVYESTSKMHGINIRG